MTEKEKLDNLDIKDLDIKDLIPQSFNGTIVTVMNDKHTIQLPDGMDGPKFKTFRKSNGGVFNRDVLAWKRGKEHGKYVSIEGHGERKIVRLIEDDEMLLFQTLKLIKGIVKDKPYMLVRNLEPGDIYLLLAITTCCIVINLNTSIRIAQVVANTQHRAVG